MRVVGLDASQIGQSAAWTVHSCAVVISNDAHGSNPLWKPAGRLLWAQEAFEPCPLFALLVDQVSYGVSKLFALEQWSTGPIPAMDQVPKKGIQSRTIRIPVIVRWAANTADRACVRIDGRPRRRPMLQCFPRMFGHADGAIAPPVAARIAERYVPARHMAVTERSKQSFMTRRWQSSGSASKEIFLPRCA